MVPKLEGRLFTPICIVGNSRSGTTLMSHILRRNQDIFGFRELHFFEQIWSEQAERQALSRNAAIAIGARLLTIQDKGYLSKDYTSEKRSEAEEMLQSLADDELKLSNIYKTFLMSVTIKGRKILPCEQTPRNIYYINEIATLFPMAKFIHMVRDPRDILASQKRKWRRRKLAHKKIPLIESIRSWANYNPIVMSKLWNSAVRAGLKGQEKHTVLTVRFEDLLRDPDKKLREICAFLGVEFHPVMLDVEQGGSSHLADNTDRVGINPEVAGRWRQTLNSAEIFICEKTNAAFMTLFNYDLAKPKPDYFALSLSYISFLIKLLGIVVLNARRYKNLLKAVKKRI